MKKTISVLSLSLIVFLCSSFPVFAVTSGGKTIVSSSYSYNNGDVTLYVRVNGHYDEDTYSNANYHYSYQHSFTVTLANNSDEFQVADTNIFSVDLYTGYTDTFASSTNNTPDGSTMYRPSWGSEVTSYSDNMTVPRILMYPTGDNAGHVLVTFSDSDLLVLNPNETRTYNFTINFNSTSNINSYPINGSYMYSYFTYAGSVSMYSRPTSFSGNTIEDFINNDSIPNSAVAYYQNLLLQGVEDQSLYNDIINNLYFNGSLNLPTDMSSSSYSFSNSVVNNIRNFGRVIKGKPQLIDSSIVLDPSNDTSYTLYSYKIPVLISIFTDNLNGYSVRNYTYQGWYTLNMGDSNYVVTSFSSSLFQNYNLENNTSLLSLQGKFLAYNNATTMPIVIPVGRFITNISLDYYYQTSDPSYVYNVPNVSFSYLPSSYVEYNTLDYDNNEISVLTKIKMMIQSILDSYNANQPNASDLDDSSDNLETELDNVHTQEQQWYSDNEAAIQATGLSNYQFSSSQISGLTAIRSQFSDIWDALGDWNLVYIFTLLLSFATFILRHRPTTKAQQRYKEQSANRSLQREYYTSRMYDNNSGQGDLMQAALRKYR